MGILSYSVVVLSVCLSVCLSLVSGSVTNNPGLNSLVDEAKNSGLNSLVAEASNSGGIDLETPEWLQNVTQMERVEKYRKRRFLEFPTASALTISFTLTIPSSFAGLSDSSSFEGTQSITYNLPTAASARSYDQLGHSRQDLYYTMETYLNGMGYDGHICVLRAICELAELPVEHGIAGELVNILFSVAAPSAPETMNYVTDDYATAEYYGKTHGECWSIYNKCPVSVVNMLSKLVPDI